MPRPVSDRAAHLCVIELRENPSGAQLTYSKPMRLLACFAWLLSVPALFAQLWYSNANSGSACCVIAGPNGAFYVVSGGQGVSVSSYSANSSSTDSTLISSSLTPMTAVLSGASILVAGAAANGTGFVSAFPAGTSSLPAGTSGFVPWKKTLGTVAAGGALTGIALDRDGGIWITGYTRDPNYPVTSDAYQKAGPTTTSFGTAIFGVLTKLSADGQNVIYSTFLGDAASACVGGSRCIGVFGNTLPAGVAVAADGSIVIAGMTTAPNFPVTANAIVPTLKTPAGNGFVTSFEPGGKRLRYSTFLGGTGAVGLAGDSLKFIAAESGGGVLVAGETHSSDFPVTLTALQSIHKGNFGNWSISRISATGTLVYSTYYGGSGADSLGGMAEDSAGNIWLAGRTTSTDFPLIPGSLRLGSDALVELDSTVTKALLTQLLPAGSADGALAPDSTGQPVILGSSGSILRLTTRGATGSQILGMTNAAAPVLSRYIAPGEIMSLYGTGLAPGGPVTAVADANGKLPTTLNGVSINTSGGLASILYTSPTQVNFIAPLGLDATRGFQFMTFQQGSTFSSTVTPTAKLSQPEIAVVLNQDFTVNSQSNPAAANSTVVLYLFGGGAFQGNPPDGTVAGNTLWAPVLNVTSSVGKVGYAGSAPGLLFGVMQVNVQLVPLTPSPSYVLLNLLVGYETSNSVQVFLK